MGIWQPDMPSIEDGVRSALAGKGKSDAHRRIEASRDHGHPDFHLDYANEGREAQDRASPILVGRFSKDRSLITHLVLCKGAQHRRFVGKLVSNVLMSGVQTLAVKSDQEVSIADVKHSLMIELRGVEGLKVMPEESPVGPRAATAVIERSVWEMQSTTRALVAHAGWVHETTLELGSVMLTGSGVLGTGGQQVKEKLFGWEDSRRTPEADKQPQSAGSLLRSGDVYADGERNCVGTLLGQVDRSDEVVVGTT